MKTIFIVLVCFFNWALAVDMYEVKKDHWLKEMRVASGKLCDKGGYFSECFDLGDKKCSVEIISLFDSCQSKVSVPAKFNVLEKGETLGQKIGVCVGSQWEKKFLAQKSDSPKCFSRSEKWQK